MLQKLVNLKNVQYPWYPGASPCRDVHFLARSKKKGAKIKKPTRYVCFKPYQVLCLKFSGKSETMNILARKWVNVFCKQMLCFFFSHILFVEDNYNTNRPMYKNRDYRCLKEDKTKEIHLICSLDRQSFLCS